MNEMHEHEHDWALNKLTAYSLGMLPEAQTLRLDEHLRDCADCSARLAPARAKSSVEIGHLPASLIATWRRSTQLLSGVERKLVESHLHSCESCRATLAFVGHEPVLSPKLEVVPARAVRSEKRHGAWSWALGLSAVSAAAAAWLLVVQPALFPHDPRTSATMGAVKHPAPAVEFELALPLDTPETIQLPERTAAGGVQVVTVGALSAEAGLVLRLPEELWPATAGDGEREVVLTLLQGGRESGRRICRLAELGEVVRLRAASALPAGDYELRASLAAADASAPARVWTWTLRAR